MTSKLESVPDITHYQKAKPEVRELMLLQAEEFVEATWRGAESLDGRASSLLSATGTLGAAALGGLTLGLTEGLTALAWGSGGSLVVFLVGSIVAAWLSKGHQLFPKSFPSCTIASDSADGKSRDQILIELARLCDKHAAANDVTNGKRSQLLSIAAYSIPAGLAVGLVFGLASHYLPLLCAFTPRGCA